MAYDNSGGPQYSMQDMARMMHDLSYGDEGMLANIVFSRPRESYTYDNVAATLAMSQRAYFDKYMKLMTQVPSLNRQKSLAASTGLGGNLMTAVNAMMTYSPAAAFNVIQHHGGEQAVETLLSSNNAIAAARGVQLGGVLSPRQLSDNMKFAASQGALAYQNNFNNDGSINVEQTHGVNLPTAALIASRTLSDSSQYDAWAKRMHGKGPGLSQDELKLDSREIDNFKNGIGTTARAEKSFNEQIKKFTGEINKFVSSVSKLTGDYTSAIDFLQKATGGKLFSAGEDAARSREKVLRMSLNMRAIAADAGMDSRDLMFMALEHSQYAGAGMGLDEEMNSIGINPVTARMGALSAAGLAKWQQMNPNASAADKYRAEIASRDRMTSYMQGDSSKLNVIAAYMADTGKLDKEMWKNVAKSGNAEEMLDVLAKAGGGRDRIRRMMNDRKQMEWMGIQYADTAFEFHSDTLAGGGFDQEQIRKGSRNMFKVLKRNAASELVGERENAIKDMEKDMGVSRSSIMLDPETLKAVGITDPEKIAQLKQNAEKHGYTDEEIIKNISKLGGRTSKLKEITKEKMIAAATDKYGADSQQVKTLKGPEKASDFDKRVDEIERESLLDDKTLIAANIKDERRRKKIQDEAKKGKWSSDRILKEIEKEGGDLASASLVSNELTVGKLETEFKGSAAVKTMRDRLNDIQGSTSLGEAQQSAYTDILTRSHDEALDSLRAAIKTEKDPAKKAELQKALRSKVDQGLKGENGYVTTNGDYLENLLTAGLKDKNLSPEKQKEYVEGARKMIEGALAGGASIDSAFNKVRNSEEFGDKFEKNFDANDKRVAAYEQARDENALTATTRRFAKEAGINLSSEEFESKMKEAHKMYAEAKKKNPDATNEAIYASIFRPLFAEQLKGRSKEQNNVAEDLLNKLAKGEGELYETMENADMAFQSSSVRADRSSFSKQVEKILNPKRMDAIKNSALEAYEQSGKNVDHSKFNKELKKLQDDKKNAGMSQGELVQAALKNTVGEDAYATNGGAVGGAVKSAELAFDMNPENLIKSLAPLMKDQRNKATLQEIGSKLGLSGDASDELAKKAQVRMEALKKDDPSLSEDELLRRSAEDAYKEMHGGKGPAKDITGDMVKEAKKDSEGSFNETVRAEASRMVLDRVHKKSRQTLGGMSIGGNDINDFHRSYNTASLNAPMAAAASAMFGDLGAKLIEQQDAVNAKEQNKLAGTFTGDNLKRIERQLNVDDKMEKLGKTKGELLKSIKDNKNNNLKDENELAVAFAAFNEQNAGVSDKDYIANFTKRFGEDGLKKLQELQKSSGMSMQEAVSSIAAGANETDENKRKQKERAAYVEEHVNEGAPELSKDQKVAGYLFQLVEMVETIKNQQANGNLKMN